MKQMYWILILGLVTVSAFGRDRFPENPDWFAVGDTEAFEFQDKVLRLDARESLHGVTVSSRDFKIDALQNYRFEVFLD